jgi:hypothetical protein
VSEYSKNCFAGRFHEILKMPLSNFFFFFFLAARFHEYLRMPPSSFSSSCLADETWPSSLIFCTLAWFQLRF